LYVDEAALVAAGFDEDDLVDDVEPVGEDKILELIEEAEASLVY